MLALLGAGVAVLLRGTRHLIRLEGGIWRLGVAQLWRNRLLTVAQMVAFGAILWVAAVMHYLGGELLQAWQQQLPPKTPNHFALNIQPQQLPQLQQQLTQAGITDATLYPVVRGRLVMLNSQPISAALMLQNEGGDNALQRELNLTWSAALPPQNEITAGHWWSELAPEPTARLPVSVESELAQRLAIRLGDSIQFQIADRLITAQVASLRRVRWDNFRPNFYFIFPPQTLDNLPTTYMTSLYLEPQQGRVKTDLVRQITGLTLIDVAEVLAQIRAIMGQLAAGVEWVLLLILLAALLLLLAALQATLDERLQQGALLRVLGLNRSELWRMVLAEYGLLGGLAGGVAAVGLLITNELIGNRLMELALPPPWGLIALLPLLGVVLIGAAGLLGHRAVVSQSPLRLLRR